MFEEEFAAAAAAARAKAAFLKRNPAGYFLASMLAGAFIGFGVLLAFTIGGLLEGAAYTKVLMGVSFGVALSLVVMAGGELFTGNNFVMAFGAIDQKVTWKETGKVWLVSYIGNFVGCLILTLIFVWAGAAGTKDYFAGFINNKLSIPLGEMFFRAVLCNFFVCLGVLCGIKLKSEAAKILMIIMCISGFVISGFEHSIANMSTFVAAYCLVPGLSVTAMLKSMLVVTVGNMVGGAVLLAWPLRKMSADQ